MKKKLNVVLFNDNFEPTVDGVVKTVLNYANHLAKNDIVSVVCPKYYKCKDKYKFPVYRTASLSLKKNSAIGFRAPNLKVKEAIRNQNADIYHAHSPFMMGHMALREARRNNVPLVATFHSKYREDFMQFTNNNEELTKFAMNYIMKFYNNCDAVWTCSNDTAKTLRSYGYNGEITIMQNGTDFATIENIEDVKEQVSKIYNINPRNRNILFVGQLIWQKNIKLILDTAKVLIDKNSKYHFYFVGAGAFEKAIKDYAKSLKISDNITFTGVIFNENILRGIYASCDLFFFPSIYDNAPLVLREAAAMGLPTIVAQGATCSEVINDNVNGFIEEATVEKMSERINLIFQTRGLLKDCGKVASETIPIKWSVIIEEVKNEYCNIIEEYKKKNNK